MIRFRRLPPELLDAWLQDQGVPAPHAKYRLRVWRESREDFEAIQAEVIAYFNEAFDDARQRLRRGFSDDLSPFTGPATDPAANYPGLLHEVTLQGYLGEVLAVVAVEHWGAHGNDDWLVPAFLFRLHDVEFQHLESINERLLAEEAFDPDSVAELRPGRTGDDGLAFRLNGNKIVEVLTLEAKCLTRSKKAKIVQAHEKLSGAPARPPGIRELINLLQDYDTPEAQRWQQALLELWQTGYRKVKRHDGIVYVCGHSPRRNERLAWLPGDAPHESYTAKRQLEGIEFQFSDLPAVIDAIYR